jgi:hypothetical protein
VISLWAEGLAKGLSFSSMKIPKIRYKHRLSVKIKDISTCLVVCWKGCFGTLELGILSGGVVAQ